MVSYQTRLETYICELEEAIRCIGDIDKNNYNASSPELHAMILKALDLVRCSLV